MSNGESDERARSPVWKLEDWAEWVDLGRGRRWDRDEAISNVNQNDAFEQVTSVFFVAEGMQTKEISGREYPEKVIGEAVVFVNADEAYSWAEEQLDGDFEVVEVSIKNQT